MIDAKLATFTTFGRFYHKFESCSSGQLGKQWNFDEHKVRFSLNRILCFLNEKLVATWTQSFIFHNYFAKFSTLLNQ